MLSRVCTMTHRVKSSQISFSVLSSAGRVKVEHDRKNQRFTVTTGSGIGRHTAGVEAPLPALSL